MDPVTTVCLVCGLPIFHQGEHETSDDCCEALEASHAELLEVLKAILADATCETARRDQRLWPIRAEHYRRARAAIAKAQGE